MKRRAIRTCALTAWAWACTAVSAQSSVGPFAEFNTWWVHPSQATTGVSYDGVNIRIDRDGDGTTESTYAPPASMPPAARFNLRLSPSREVLYAFGGSCAAGGTLVHFYGVPSGAGSLTPIRTNLCISGGILRHPGFYDTSLCDPVVGGPGLDCAPGGVSRLGGSPQRIAYLVSQGQGSTLDITWIDLDSGDVGTTAGLDPGLGFIQVSPSGTMAFVQQDLPVPAETDYKFVDLCPGNLGAILDTGGVAFDNQPGDPYGTALTASVTLVVGGDVTVEAASQNGQAIGDFTVADCFGFFPTGACCHSDGTCDAAATQLQCQSAGGDWLGVGGLCGSCPLPPTPEACCYLDGRACEDTDPASCAASGGASQGDGSTCGLTQCPTVNLSVNKTGPATVQTGELIDYVLSYSNTGAANASGVRIVDAVPVGSTFASASAGGGEQGGVVTWNIGDVSAGASGQVSFSCRADCGTSQITNHAADYQITDAVGALVQGADDVLTDVIDLPASSITMTVDSSPSAGVPLHSGDSVTHTITMVNTSGVLLSGVYLGESTGRGIDYGNAVHLVQVIDDGGGLVSTNGGRLDWQGDIPASASTTIVFSTLVDFVDPCAGQSVVQTRLNFGDTIRAFNGCAQEMASVNPPPAFDIQPDPAPGVSAAISATNLAPAQVVRTSALDYRLQLARPRDDVNFDLVLTNSTPQLLSTVDIAIDITGLDLPANPFTSAMGATYSAVSGEITWSGSIPANQSVTISFTGQVDACRADLSVTGGTGPACSNIDSRTVVAAVPVSPTDSYLAAAGVGIGPDGSSSEGQAFVFDPATDTDLRTLLCVPSESMTRMGIGASGEIWIGGEPTIRFNPETLDYDVIDLTPIQTAGLSIVQDIASDPVTDVVYFLGESASFAPPLTAVVRYDPLTAQADLLIDTIALASVDSAVVDRNGMIAIAGWDGNGAARVVRIAPDDPSGFDVFDGGGLIEPSGLSIGSNGEYVVVDGPNSVAPWALATMDSTNGSVSVIARDLQTLVSISQPPVSTAVAPNGEIYIAPGAPGLARIGGNPPAGTVVIPLGTGGGVIHDMEFVDLGTNGGGGSSGGGSGGGGSGGGGSGGGGSGDGGGGGGGSGGGGSGGGGSGAGGGNGDSGGGIGGGSAATGDQDADGVPDETDNCPKVANPDQADTDTDGIGDACERPIDAPDIVFEPDPADDNAPPAGQPVPPTNLVIDDADSGGFGAPQDIASNHTNFACGAGGLCGALSAINLLLIVVGMSRMRTRTIRQKW